ncbi:MAG: tetratricopeptide repeat protein [Blautia sp.]|nr:tetratricopeptide repeat protein [Blautia sp.]
MKFLTEQPSYLDETNVICRKKEISDLQALIHQEKSFVIINGFGGIGKSAIAKLLYHKMHQEFEQAAWIPYEKDLKSSFISSIFPSIDARLSQKEITLEERWKILSDSLMNNGLKKLFFIDNVEYNIKNEQDPLKDTNLKNISGWPDTTVVITSRYDRLFSYRTYEVGFLDDRSCLELFLYYLPQKAFYADGLIKGGGGEEKIMELVHLALNHTLTIELLAKGAKYERSLDEYIGKLRENGFQSVDSAVVETNYDLKKELIIEHLKILFDLQKRNESEKKTLLNFSALPTLEKISIDEAERWMNLNKTDCANLEEEGWLDYGGGFFSIHPLIKEIILSNYSDGILPCGSLEFFVEYIADEKNGFFNDTDKYTLTNRKLNIVHNLIKCVGMKKKEPFVSLYSEIAKAYRMLGLYEKELEYLKYDLRLKKEIYGENSASTAGTYNSIGLNRCHIGNWKGALAYLQKAKQIYAAAAQENTPEMVEIYDNLGVVYKDMGKTSVALRYFEQALSMCETQFGREHTRTAEICEHISIVYWIAGDYGQALKYNKDALDIYEKNLDKDHVNIGKTYNFTGIMYSDMGDYKNALFYYQKAVGIVEDKLGENHPYTAKVYNNTGIVYWNMGNYEKAIQYYALALKINKERLGGSHPETAKVYNNIALVYHDSGNNEKALKYYEKSRKAYEISCGKEHPETARTYSNIAVVYCDMGDYETALKYHRTAIDVLEQKLGVKNFETINAYNNISLALRALKRYSEALAYLETARESCETYGGAHLETARSYHNMGLIYRDIQNYEMAIECFEKALSIRTLKLGAGHAKTRETRKNLEETESECGKK